MTYLNEHGLSLLWKRMKSAFDNRYTYKHNAGKYANVIAEGYSFSNPLYKISDTSWHEIPLFSKDMVVEGDLIESGVIEQYGLNSSFVARTNGVFAVNASVQFCGDTGSITGWIRIKNGTESDIKNSGANYWYPISSGSHATITTNACAVLTMSENDAFSIEVSHSGSNNMYIIGACVSITCLSDLTNPDKYSLRVTDLAAEAKYEWADSENPRLSSTSSKCAFGVSTENAHLYRSIYMMPVDSRASKIEIIHSNKSLDLSGYDFCYIGYKDVNGVLTRVFSSGYVNTGQTGTYEWEAGSIDFIAVSYRFSSGMTVRGCTVSNYEVYLKNM